MRKIYIVSGGPASGKGTRCKILSKSLKMTTVSTGDLLREKAKTDEDVANQLKTGVLLPEKLVYSLLCERIMEQDCEYGFILDGYPRNLKQAQIIHELFGNNFSIKIIELQVSKDTVMQRILGRKICNTCGETVNVSPNTVICECGGELETRSDDTPETLEKRLDIFNQNQQSIRNFFRSKGYEYVFVSSEENPELILASI